MKIKHNGWESSVFRQIFIIFNLLFHLNSTINPFVKFPLFPCLAPKIQSLKLFKTIFIYLFSNSLCKFSSPHEFFVSPQKLCFWQPRQLLQHFLKAILCLRRNAKTALLRSFCIKVPASFMCALVTKNEYWCVSESS